MKFTKNKADIAWLVSLFILFSTFSILDWDWNLYMKNAVCNLN